MVPAQKGNTVEVFAKAAFSGTDLACRRGGRRVFSGLDFSVTAGEALVLRGPNGSGKTTLLRLMAGLTRPARGRLAWDDAPVEPETHGAKVRFVSHLDAIKPALTVRENLLFWRDLWGGHKAVETAAAGLGLGHLATFPARLLSAGQRHRLALARLLVAPAPLWLLDEPGNALDDASLEKLGAIIKAHRAMGGMVVIASHGASIVEDGKTLDLGAFAGGPEVHWSEAV